MRRLYRIFGPVFRAIRQGIIRVAVYEPAARYAVSE